MSSLRRIAWELLGRPAMRLSPHPAYGFRRRLLRAFGMTVAPTVRIRRSVLIDRPWNVRADDLAIVGDDASIIAAEPVVIGARCVVSQLAVLATEVAGRLDGPARGSVTLDDDAWVAADVLVLPGTTVGRGVVVGARGTAAGDLPPWRVAVGRPAVPRGHRSFDRGGEPAAVAGAPAPAEQPTAHTTAGTRR